MSLEHFNDCALFLIWVVASITILIISMGISEKACDIDNSDNRDFVVMPHDRTPKFTRGDGWLTVDMPHEHLSFKILDEDEDE